VTIRNIQRKRVNVPFVTAGQSASFALKKVRRQDIRKGMVMLQKTEMPPRAVREFVAEGASQRTSLLMIVMILYHQTTIKPKYQAMLHVNATAQTCQIVSIDTIHRKSKSNVDTSDEAGSQILRTGDRGLVRFRFMQRAEYLKEGTKLIFREGRTKGLGSVKEVFPVKESVTGSTISSFPEGAGRSHTRSSTKDGSVKSPAPTGRFSNIHSSQSGDMPKTMK
jgi:GTPase